MIQGGKPVRQVNAAEKRTASELENKVVDYAKGALTGDWGDVWGVAKG